MPRTPRSDLKVAIELFLAELSAFETRFLGMVLQSLSNDSSFVGQTQALLDVGSRLTLLRRMAHVRNLNPYIIAQLDAIDLRARRLLGKRDEFRRILSRMATDDGKSASAFADCPQEERRSGWAAAQLSVRFPTEMEIDEYRNEATELQATVRAIAEQVDGCGVIRMLPS